MAVLLTAKERDKSVLALRDIKGLLEFTRKVEFENLHEVQTILAGYGLQIAPLAVVLPAPSAPVVPAPATAVLTSATSPPAGQLTTNELGWIETLTKMYQQYKYENRQGYVLNMNQLSRLLTYTCRLAGIKFKP